MDLPKRAFIRPILRCVDPDPFAFDPIEHGRQMRTVVDTAGGEIHGDDVFGSLIDTQVQLSPGVAPAFPHTVLAHVPLSRAPNTFSPVESFTACRLTAAQVVAADLCNNATSSGFSLLPE